MRKRFISSFCLVAAVLLGAVTPCVAGPHAFPEVDSGGARRFSVDYYYLDLGKSYSYETGFGRVDVKSAGTAARARMRPCRKVELGFTYFDFDVDSYFLGTQVGESRARAGLYSIRKRFSVNGEATDLEYGYLDSASIPAAHFLSLTRTRHAYGIDWAGGLTSWSGDAVKDRIGVFASAAWSPDPTLTLFAQYSTADFTKAFQNTVIAPAALNIGTVDTGNAPRDALSLGVSVRVLDTANVTFTVYDPESQMKPALGISHSW